MAPSYEDVHPFYGGKQQTATSGKTFQSIDPSTGDALATIHESSHADIDSAVASAAHAFHTWSATPPAERARVLLAAAALLRQRNDELATTETHDTGKPFSETSTVDVATGADVLEYFAHLVAGGGLNGETTQLRPDALVYTTKAPLGVCVGIGAWNYPIQIALWKSAPCLAAGNTMVYKPSEVTPLHATTLAAIYAAAGLPPGAFNVVHGDGAAVGARLVSHPGVAKVSFTGQVSTGQAVASAAAHGMRYVTMELGGKSPLLVLPDARPDDAADAAMMANFFSTGQVCTNGTRVFVPRSLRARFEAALLARLAHVRPGDPLAPATNFGPLVSAAHLAKVRGYIAHGRDVDGARVLYDGAASGPALPARGFWCAPIVFTDCADEMRVVREEIFGPVMCILFYDDSAAAAAAAATTSQQPDAPPPTASEAAHPWLAPLLARANATPLGLAAGVVTRDLALAHHVVARLEAGITWINTWGESPAEMSVGGWKMSGVGVENGRRGIEAWVRNKSTLVELGGRVASVFAPSQDGTPDTGKDRAKL